MGNEQQEEYAQQIHKLEQKLHELSGEHTKMNRSRINRIQNHEEEVKVLVTDNNRLCAETEILREHVQNVKATKKKECFDLEESIEIEKARRFIQVERHRAALKQIPSLRAEIHQSKRRQVSHWQDIQQLSTLLSKVQMATSAKNAGEEIGESVDVPDSTMSETTML